MQISEEPLFYNSLLLFSDEQMNMLVKSTVALAGIGGVGSIVVEMLARNGIGNLRVSDLDPYEEKNMNRQIFATLDTVGVNKAVAATKRIHSINPACNVRMFDNGIHLHNVEEFCQNSDVVVVETDTESAKIIIHRTAQKMGIPVICGSRGSLFEHRWMVKARVWDYRKHPDLPCYDQTNHPDLAQISDDSLTDDMLAEYDAKIKAKKLTLFSELARSNPGFFGNISQEALLDRIENHSDYFNRHVCSVLANTGGILAATATIRYLLGGPEGELRINLWNGEA